MSPNRFLAAYADTSKIRILKSEQLDVANRQAGVSMLKAYVYDFAFRVGVAGVVFGAAVFAIIYDWREIKYYPLDYRLYNVVFMAFLGGLVFGTIAYVKSLVVQMRRYDEATRNKIDNSYYEPQQVAVNGRSVPKNIGGDLLYRTPKTLHKGSRDEFTFPGDVLDKVADWIQSNEWDGYLTGRKGKTPYSLQEAGLGDNIEQGRALAALNDMGYRGEDRKLTALGRNFFIVVNEFE